MGKGMNKQYDFSQGRRGPVVPLSPGKTRITIRLDKDIIEWFRNRVEARNGGSYQTLINSALREHVRRGGESLESWLRRIIREELRNKVSGNRARPIF